jgi:hypothetical protein
VAGKTPNEARDNFIRFLRETLSCVTKQELTAFRQSSNLYKVWFDPPALVIARNGTRLYISITQIFTVKPDGKGEYKVSTREYSYIFSQTQEVNYHGILAYHWHPHDFEVRDPHLHITITPAAGYPEIERKISRAHFPTSRVALEDFVTLLIKYYDIKPQLPDARWKRYLKKNKSAFDKYATWKIQHPK